MENSDNGKVNLHSAFAIYMPKRYTPNDKWSQKAQSEGYRARSVYKLMALDERFSLVKPGMNVVDLGAAPGSWLQYVAEKCRMQTGECRIIGVDLQAIEPIDGVETFVGDIADKEAIEQIFYTCFNSAQHDKKCVDLLLSDLAPKTSGIKDVDQWKSIELSQAVLAIANRWLKPNGTVVLKVLRGADFDAFLAELKQSWKSVKIAQVEASRDRSREVYLILDGNRCDRR